MPYSDEGVCHHSRLITEEGRFPWRGIIISDCCLVRVLNTRILFKNLSETLTLFVETFENC